MFKFIANHKVIHASGQLENYLRVSPKLKLDIFGDDFSLGVNSSTPRFRKSTNDSDASATTRTSKIPEFYYDAVQSIEYKSGNNNRLTFVIKVL